MLKFLRKKENLKKIMWGLAILIIPAFVLWGSGSAVRSRNQPKYAGRIFGKKISFRQYEASLLAYRNQYLLMFGKDFTRIARFLNLEEQAWERLILLYQAKKEKIEVTDEEVINFIRKMPLFQKEGVFDQEKYRTLLDYVFRTSARDFEEQIREALRIDKLKNKVMEKVTLTEEEIKNAYKNEKEKARALYIFFDPEKFKDLVHTSYEEIQDYYQTHKTEFKKPEQVNVEYIALYFDRARSEVEVTEEEIQSYYQKHPRQFSTKDKKGKESVRPLEEVKNQIEERLIQEKVRKFLEDKIWRISDDIGEEPNSFKEVAEKYQLELKETGFFGPEQVIPEIGLSYEFSIAAFSLKPGEISNIIETPKGYFIIKVKEKKEAYIAELEEVKEEIEKAVIRQKAWQLAKDKSEESLSKIKRLAKEEKLNFSKAAERLSLAVRETEEFTRSSYISGIGQSKEFSEAAFALKPGQISEIISVPNGYCILSLKDIIPIDEEKFIQEKEEYAKRLLAKKKEEFYKAWLTNLKKKANLISNIEKLKDRQPL